MDENVSKFGVPIIVGLVSFAVGVGVGYFLSNRRKIVPTHIVPAVKDMVDEDELEEEIERHPSSSKVEEFVTETLSQGGVVIVDDIEDIDEDDIVSQTVHASGTHELLSKRIFAEGEEGWDYQEELAKRDETRPYIIHKDEFYADERDYTQSTLTYYSGDDIMVDEDESPVYMHATIVGELIFGHGSGDSNVVYVRNSERKAEYEILFDPGLYSIEVLGLEIENNTRVKAVKNGPPKFKRNE